MTTETEATIAVMTIRQTAHPITIPEVTEESKII